MRMQLFPGLKWWYHISLAGLVYAIGSFMEMTMTALGQYKKKDAIFYYCIATAALLFNIVTEWIIAPPKTNIVRDGIQYEYQVNAGILLGLIPLLVIVSVFGFQVAKVWRTQRAKIGQIRNLLIALAIVLIGNIAIILPGVYFPVDVASGIVAALFLVATFYQRHLFILSERMMVGVIYMLGLILASVPLLFFRGFYESLPASDSAEQVLRFMQSYLIVTGIWMVLLFFFASFLNSHYLMQREQEVQESINAFHSQLNSSLDVDTICRLLLETLLKLTTASGAIIEICDSSERKGQSFSIGTLQGKRQLLENTPQFMNYILECEECFFLRSSVGLDGFVYASAMRKWLAERNYEAIGCLKNDRELIGFVFLQQGQTHVTTRERERQISTVCYSAASALRNAFLYQKLYEESITDELTGAYNRKYVLENIGIFMENPKPFGLLYLDIDDFRIYNEIYGVEEGDNLLQRCVEILKQIMPEDAKICRYTADAFVVFCWNDSVDEVYSRGMEVLKMIADETGKSTKHLHYITMSGGVSAYPQIGQTAAETLHQATQATSQAKENGRNQIFIYNKENQNQKEQPQNAYEDVKPTIYALTAAIDAKDSFTFMHVQKVSEYATALAKAIGYSKENVEIIRQAALLHDIGKISIPERILQKKGKLSEEEYEIMRNHVANSIDIIQFLPGMDYVIPAVIGHHERYDGKGYPRGIAGDYIPESARILAIADSFDAMTAKRSYKEAQPIEYALEELERCKGSQFDPKLVDAFANLIHKGKIHLEKKND